MVNFFRFLLTAEKMSFAGGFAPQAGSGGYPPAGHTTPSSSSTPSTQVELAVKCTGNITLLPINHSWAQRKLSPLSPLNILLSINGPLLS